MPHEWEIEKSTAEEILRRMEEEFNSWSVTNGEDAAGFYEAMKIVEIFIKEITDQNRT